jgi:hypothetical protein
MGTFCVNCLRFSQPSNQKMPFFCGILVTASLKLKRVQVKHLFANGFDMKYLNSLHLSFRLFAILADCEYVCTYTLYLHKKWLAMSLETEPIYISIGFLLVVAHYLSNLDFNAPTKEENKIIRTSRFEHTFGFIKNIACVFCLSFNYIKHHGIE